MNKEYLVLLFVAAVLDGIAYFFLHPARVSWDKYRASAGWATTRAKIVHSEITGGGREGEGYRPDIQYTYTVNGKKYRNDKVWFGLDSTGISLWPIKNAVELYPVGKSVLIYYNPNDPQESILERKYIWTNVLLGLLSLVLSLLLFIPILVRTIRSFM